MKQVLLILLRIALTHAIEWCYQSTSPKEFLNYSAQPFTANNLSQIQINFSAFNKEFNLTFYEMKKSHVPTFVGGKEVNGDLEPYLIGMLNFEKKSLVTGFITKGIFHGMIIESPYNAYSVEMCPHGDFHSTIFNVTKNSFPEVTENIKDYVKEQSYRIQRKRVKRSSTIIRNVCEMYIKADYNFYSSYRSIKEVEFVVVQMVEKLIVTFKQTRFAMPNRNATFPGVNFQIKRLEIEDSSSIDSSKFISHEVLLKNLKSARLMDSTTYCVALQLTSRNFRENVLGYANVGSKNAGPCTKGYNLGVITNKHLNTLSDTFTLTSTFIHEIGHIFGADHDPMIPGPCTPGYRNGGNYIMYHGTTSGGKPNNDKFSNCSLKQMREVISLKFNCFAESEACGNGVLDENEECDSAFSCENDECCDCKCKLKKGKKCSPLNSNCCTKNCQFYSVAEKHICKQADECVDSNYTCGENGRCEMPKFVQSNGKPCELDTRICQNGSCSLSKCSKINLQECKCKNSEWSCYLCCQRGTECKPAFQYNGLGKSPLYPGSLCKFGDDESFGYCDIFMKCRRPGRDHGDLLKITENFFNVANFLKIINWMKTHPILGVFLGIFVTIFSIAFVEIFAVHTPSNNPRQRPPIELHDYRDYIVDNSKRIRNSVDYIAGKISSHPTNTSRKKTQQDPVFMETPTNILT